MFISAVKINWTLEEVIWVHWCQEILKRRVWKEW